MTAWYWFNSHPPHIRCCVLE